MRQLSTDVRFQRLVPVVLRRHDIRHGVGTIMKQSESLLPLAILPKVLGRLPAASTQADLAVNRSLQLLRCESSR